MNVEVLLGRTIKEIKTNCDNTPGCKPDEIRFFMEDGKAYLMYHSQDCCERVEVEDIIGSLDDLIGSPVMMAEEVVSAQENPEGVISPSYQPDSFTWTFYKLATVKGYVTLRWYGESNGYYSESVNFEEVR